MDSTLPDNSGGSVPHQIDDVAVNLVEAQRQPDNSDKQSTKHNCTMLNKAERKEIINRIQSMIKSNITIQVESYFE